MLVGKPEDAQNNNMFTGKRKSVSFRSEARLVLDCEVKRKMLTRKQ